MRMRRQRVQGTAQPQARPSPRPADGLHFPPPSPGPALPRVLRPRELRVAGGVCPDGQVLCDHAGQ